MLGEKDFVLESGEAAEFSCRVPHWLGAVDGPAEALAIFGPPADRELGDNWPTESEETTMGRIVVSDERAQGRPTR